MAAELDTAIAKVASLIDKHCFIRLARDNQFPTLTKGIWRVVVFEWGKVATADQQEWLEGLECPPFVDAGLLGRDRKRLAWRSTTMIPFALVVGGEPSHEDATTFGHALENNDQVDAILFFDLAAGNAKKCPVRCWPTDDFDALSDMKVVAVDVGDLGIELLPAEKPRKPAKKPAKAARARGAEEHRHGAIRQNICYENVAAITPILDGGFDLDLLSADGEDGLVAQACIYRRLEILTLFLDRGANPDLQNKEGVTGLMEAAGRGHVEQVTLLLARGAAPDLDDRWGETALVRAVRGSGLEAEIVAIVKLLIDAGARLDVTDKKGVALLKVAKSVEKEAGLSSRALTALLERAAKKK